MDMLLCHAEESGIVSEAYHEFLLKYKAHKKIVYGFVEGKEDPVFYRSLIENRLPDDWDVEFILAKNKDNVALAMSKFNWNNYDRKRRCFFVDRDLSDFIEECMPAGDNVYITDGYSIENSICTFGFFKRILNEVLGVEGLNDIDLGVVEDYYRANMELFKQGVTPLMVQIISWRRGNKRPCLNDIATKEYFWFDGNKFSFKISYVDEDARLEYAGRCVNIKNDKYENMLDIKREFLNKNGPDKYIRGKYIFKFVVDMALSLHSALPNILPRFAGCPKVNVSLGYKNAMAILGSKGRCPQCLNCFVDKTFVSYIASECP